MPDPGKIAEITLIAGYYCAGDLIDTLLSERIQLYEALAGERPSGPRAMREILDWRAPLAKSQPKKTPSVDEEDIHAAAQAIKALKGIGRILCPRRQVANMFSGTPREGPAACPS